MTAVCVAATASCYADEDPFLESTTSATETAGDTEPDDPPFEGEINFYIAETQDFTVAGAGPACQNTDLNNVGAFLAVDLDDDGIPGTYDLDGQSTPMFFRDEDAFPGGLDHQFADAARITVYAGHGQVNSLQWGQPSAGIANDCRVVINNQMRLGQINGDLSGIIIYATSCTANVPNLTSTLAQANRVGQQLGWHNSPSIPDQTLGDFYQGTKFVVEGMPLSNRISHLTAGQTKAGFAENSPVIFTTAASEAEMNDRHFHARLGLGTGIDTVIAENQTWRRWTWVDNGDCP